MKGVGGFNFFGLFDTSKKTVRDESLSKDEIKALDKVKRSKSSYFKDRFMVLKAVVSPEARVCRDVTIKVTKKIHEYRVENFQQKSAYVNNIMERVRNFSIAKNEGLEYKLDPLDDLYKDLLACFSRGTKVEEIKKVINEESERNVKVEGKVGNQIDDEKLEDEMKQDTKLLIEALIKNAQTPKELAFLAGFLHHQRKLKEDKVLTVNDDAEITKNLNKVIKGKLNSELKQVKKLGYGGYLKRIAEIHSLVAICKNQGIEISSKKADKIINYLLEELEINNDQLIGCTESTDTKVLEHLPRWRKFTMDTIQYVLKPIIELSELSEQKKKKYSDKLNEFAKDIQGNNLNYRESGLDGAGAIRTRL